MNETNWRNKLARACMKFRRPRTPEPIPEPPPLPPDTDLWKDSVCAACNSPTCFGTCPGYTAYEQKVLREERQRQARAECPYCQSKEPCFDGKSFAGVPCQHPQLVRIKLPTMVRPEFDLLQEGLHELLWKYGTGEKMDAAKTASITALMMKLRIHSKPEVTDDGGGLDS